MRSWVFIPALVAFSFLQPPVVEAGIGGINEEDSMFTLVLLQMIQQRNDPTAMQSLYPMLLANLMGKSDDTDSKKFYYLLLGAGNNPEMQQWLPLILNNKNKNTSDKLLMLMFMQQNQVVGGTDMNSMFPLLLLNANDDKYCGSGADKCTCESDNSEMLLYIMLLNGNSVGPGQNMNNFMFMLFDENKCDGKKPDASSCKCTSSDKIEGGIDAVTYMMLMQMNPVVKQQLPQAPPQRSIDVKNLLKQQMFANLGPEYAWMANVDNAEASDLVKFQLYQQMGIPPNVMSLLSNGGAQTSDERFALIQWMSRDSQLSIETMSLMLGIEDSKQFYVHSMIEQGQVDPLTASMLLASLGNVDKDKMKEMLILAATGQVDPNTFATIANPYVPRLPQGIFPGQDLFFIHLELLDLNTCAMIEPEKRKPCGKNFGSYITAEQCEVHPYCCYNPYFGANAEKVPWCYYNIFFVFHDQYKLRVREADKFKGPQDCPGLFRYGLKLDPFMYYKATTELTATTAIGNIDTMSTMDGGKKLAKLIHLRKDVGFAGITEFHCRAFMGACWDANAGQYPATYGIPQCYEEQKIDVNGGGTLNLYDPKLFKPTVPNQFKAVAGECDTNYFHISTLYYKRRACTYTIDMIKYGSQFNPLHEPTRADCLFRLGCCFEDDEEVMQQYPFMPRCYHRVADNVVDDRLNDYELVRKGKFGGDYTAVCGATEINTFLGNFNNAAGKAAIETKVGAAAGAAAQNDAQKAKYPGITYDKTANQVTIAAGNWAAQTCLFVNKEMGDIPFGTNHLTSFDDFDIFNRKRVIAEDLEKSKIPTDLQDMYNEMF
jgi:hypothetical protein